MIVNGGFQIQVGASSAVNVSKGTMRRIDQVTSIYDVVGDSTTIYIASPLGSNIYIVVPYLADIGEEVAIKNGGGVERSTIFSATTVKLQLQSNGIVLEVVKELGLILRQINF